MRMPMDAPSVLSMFSGCGGMDLGFVQAGFHVIWANDINPDACTTYRANLGEIIEADVYEVAIPKVQGLDVLTAGFPCQPFSNAGNRRGVYEARGTLYQRTLAFVAQTAPKIVLLENVRGLLSSKTDHGYLLEEICRALDQLGYQVHFKLVNAAHYGVPQNRLRVLMVGLRQDCGLGAFRFPMPRKDIDLSMGAAIANIPEGTPNHDEILHLNPQARYLGSLVPEGGSWKDIPYDALPNRLKKIRDNMAQYHWPNFYRRYGRNEIAGTITAAFKPENAGVWHPDEPRVLSAREIARLQSFPDDFVFDARSTKAVYAMIGNAVPPTLARQFAESFRRVLLGESVNAEQAVRRMSQIRFGTVPVRVRDAEVVWDSPAKSVEQLNGFIGQEPTVATAMRANARSASAGTPPQAPLGL